MACGTEAKVARRDVAAIVGATFPHDRGRRIAVEADEAVTTTDVNWSGGTRSSHAACTLDGTLDGRRVGDASRFAARHPAGSPAEGATVPIPVGAALVEHGMSCGRDLGPRIHVDPADMPRVLPVAQPPEGGTRVTGRHQPSALAGLAVVIDGPGAYRTRCGEVVRVDRASARNDFGCVGAHADGTHDGWHRSGRLMPWSPSRHDVVAPLGRDPAAPGP